MRLVPLWTTLHNLIILISFTFTSSTFLSTLSFPSSYTSPALNISATPSLLQIPILLDENNVFYINVTWRTQSEARQNQTSLTPLLNYPNDNFTSKASGKMMLSLYTSNSFVVETCPGFIPYDCDIFECYSSELSPNTTNYLYQGTTVFGFAVNIGILSEAFQVSGYTVNYANYCGANFPFNVSGMLGLGLDPNQPLFGFAKNFSVFLSDGNDDLNSSMYVGEDPDHERILGDTGFVFQGPTDKNWTVPVSNFSMKCPQVHFEVSLVIAPGHRAVFDLNSNAIGLPMDIYNNVTFILKVFGVNCSFTYHTPSCNFTDDLSQLPTFYFQSGSAAGRIEVKPEAYTTNRTDSGFILNIAATSLGLPGTLMVNPIFQHAIILGRSFLTYYYVHFSATTSGNSPSVTIYYANHGPLATPGFPWIWCLLGAGIIIVIVVALIVWAIKKKNNKNKKKISQKPQKGRPSKQGQSPNDPNKNSVFQPGVLNKSNISKENMSTSCEPLCYSGPKNGDLRWESEKKGRKDTGSHNEIIAYTYKKGGDHGPLYESGTNTSDLIGDFS